MDAARAAGWGGGRPAKDAARAAGRAGGAVVGREGRVEDEAATLARAREGDRAAFGTLVTRHREAAMKTALSLGAGADADDVVQEAFVRAFRRLPEFRGESPFRAWLLAIVANETRNLHRSRRRRDDARARAALEAPRPELADTSIASALAAEERRELVAAVSGLTEADRDVLAYRFLLDRSAAETAALLDWPVGTVKSRTARALAKLRSRLGVAIAVAAAVAVVVSVPPARTAVASAISSVLRFAGVEVHRGDPGSGGGRGVPTSSPAPLPSSRPVSLGEARRVTGFPVGVPAALGPPEAVWVSDPAPDGAPRVVTLLYRGGAVRVDEFDGELDLTFTKTARDVSWVPIGASQGIWLATPHELTYVDRLGVARAVTTRTAGPTLLWQDGAVGYRLEGLSSVDEAVRVAVSVSP